MQHKVSSLPQKPFLPRHVPTGAGVASGVGAGGGVGPLPTKHTRFAGFPPLHNPEQQSVPPRQDSSTAAPQLVGVFVGGGVGVLVAVWKEIEEEGRYMLATTDHVEYQL